MPGAYTNERLAELMRRAGFLRDDGSVGLKVFARAVGRATGGGKSYTHTYVRRWLDGVMPRDELTRQAIARALEERLGRSVAMAELGFATRLTIPADVGLRYPSDLEDGVAAIGQLLNADADDLRPILGADPNASAWNEAALSWLVRQQAAGRSPAARSGRIGVADVQRLQTTTDMFAKLDNQFGGGHARRALIEFLRTDIAPALRESGNSHPDFLSAAATAMLTAAWMSYDAGAHSAGQRYFIQALGLADAAGDALLAGSILDAMSHQATFLGRFREAANLASAARLGTSGVATPTLTAHFHAMEARALARVGDAAACDRALSEAATQFERRRPEDDPDWIAYFDEAELAAEFGHCNRDLGRAVDATTWATDSLGQANGEYLRSDFFATMVLADAYLDQGEAEEGCRVALQALEIGEQLKSARCRTYVEEFRTRLKRIGHSSALKDFEQQASTYRLWTPEQ